MSKDEHEPPSGTSHEAQKTGRPWFKPNRAGVGWHPTSWQGWLILAAGVAVIVVVVVLLRTGML